MNLKRILSIVMLTLAAPGGVRAADSIEAIESGQLRQYLTEIKAGTPGRAASVESLADISYAGLRQIMEAYVDLDGQIEPQTHRAFQALLERTSRMALAPWPLVTMYSDDLAQFLAAPASENPLAERLCERLLSSGTERRAVDLAVRLAPQATLHRLASGQSEFRLVLLEAWNRRLARAAERRPIASLDKSVDKVCHSFRPGQPAVALEVSLQFLGSWPKQRDAYTARMRECLESDDESVVSAALTVQQRFPADLEMNEAIISHFADRPAIVQAALKNYAFDSSQDHSAVLRRLGAGLKSDDERARYNCLFAMGVHPRGNDAIALAAVLDRPYAFIDVAMPVLEHGDPQLARQAVARVLTDAKRGCEEAFRLCEMKLDGFEQQAAQIALDKNRDQILRQAAMLYLQSTEGKWRRQLLPLLTDPNGDLRLTAIQVLGAPSGLSPQDREQIAPALASAALADTSMGHRQEAIYVLGNWREAKAGTAFFRVILDAHPPAPVGEQRQGDQRYWDYRLRLVALLGLTKLGDHSARDELVELHRRGGPVERMDVLLAFRDLGEVPAGAWDDLDSTEPKLVATAQQLIAAHADAAGRERLREYFRRSLLWREFQDSGLDDHNILEAAGLGAHDASR